MLLASTLLDIQNQFVKSDSHTYDSAGHVHSNIDDQTLFLGKKLKSEFDTLSLDESRRRLRFVETIFRTFHHNLSTR